jgi:signal transduction histidine kinase/CheY-like chemotaxis protein
LRAQGELTVSAAIRDISDRKRMEAEHRLMAERLTSAVESIQNAFALFDDHDRLVLCNAAYRQLLGRTSSESLAGTPYAELLGDWISNIEFTHEAEREDFRKERLERRMDAPATTFQVRLRDGRSLRVTDRRTPEGGTVKVIWDLTEDVQRAEELRQARNAAEAASNAKSEFLSSMSHELRTPMNAILGFAQLLQRDRKEPLSARHRERVDHIVKGGEHLLHLINDVLDLSRIESGSVSVSIERVNVFDVLDEVRATLEPMAIRAGIRLDAPIIPQELPLVAADRTRFVQILLNFGSNAIKYNRPQGQVGFTVSMPTPQRVRVGVRDTGPGIAADQQAKLFQPFQRAGQEAGPIEGTGIGLFITKRLAELMAANVSFASVLGEGSEFWVEVPVCQAAASVYPAQLPTGANSARVRAARRRLVLYVEDNPENVAFMRELIDSLDTYELVTAASGEQGLELARSRPPDVILLDINLPGMSGLDVMRALREDPALRDVPVFALSAAASERDKLRGLDAGFRRYLTQPVDVQQLVAALEAVP